MCSHNDFWNILAILCNKLSMAEESCSIRFPQNDKDFHEIGQYAAQTLEWKCKHLQSSSPRS